MKKLTALLLALVMCLSLAACSIDKTEADTDHSHEQKTENAQQDGKQTESEPDETEPDESEPDETEPAETEPQERTVEITLENWQEYLEINQYLSVFYNTNSFGEVTDTYLDFYTILEPKAEYSNVAERWEDSDCIAVEYDMDYCVKDIIYNLDDFSFELIDCVSHPDATVDESSFVRGLTSQIPNGVSICRYRIVDGKVEHDYIHYAMNTEKKGMSFGDPYSECVHIEQNEDGTGYITKCPTNIQITRIQGTLKYYE